MEEHTLPDAIRPAADAPTNTGRSASLPARVARISAGSGMVAAGVLMLVLPGPGLVAIAAGLGLLSKDVPAAERTLQWVRRRIPGAQRVERIPTTAVITTLSATAAMSVAATWLLTAR